MSCNRSLYVVLAASMLVNAASAQTGKKSPVDEQNRTIRVGIATTINRSTRAITPIWERDQLVRELQRLRTDRKSRIVLEPVSLEATEREDASTEAEKKSCQYFVLTTVLNPSRGPGISAGPDGTQRAPMIIGNTDPNRNVAMNFTILEVGTARTVAEGTAAAPVEDNDSRAADDAMRSVAHRVASELRNSRPPSIN